MVSFSFHKNKKENYSPSLKFALSLSLTLKKRQLKHPKGKQDNENKAVTCT